MWDVPAAQLPEAIEVCISYLGRKSNFSYFQQALTISTYIYLALAGIIKLSCLLFYRRVFSPNKATLVCIYGGIWFVAISYTAMVFATIFECIPVRRTWNKLTPGHCYPAKILPYFSGALNVVTDIYVLVLPIPSLWHLNLKMSRKIRVMAIFALGILYVQACHIKLRD